jgi:ADP-ribosylglycohydrolase
MPSPESAPGAAPKIITSAAVRSALWAAWGDALGFPAELASPSLLERRLDASSGNGIRAWPRRVGGRMGPTVRLPAGCTSDDTQLRLAVGRCIRTSGRFDVEAFSKIELPIFLSYELGAGRGTKAAARALARRSTRWFSNFFETKTSSYMNGGGNGAAMRIQPHVWAARNAKPETYLSTVLRDTVCTHGHLRGILGAALHAISLGTALRQGGIPSPERWPGMVAHLSLIGDLVHRDEVLGERWLPVWEKQSGESFEAALETTIGELQKQVRLAGEASEHIRRDENDASLYSDLVRALGGFDSNTRGAGTISAVLALWLSWTYSERSKEGVTVAASLLESDTDTIATMAGAILGAISEDSPPGEVLDAKLIVKEASRFERMSRGEQTANFPHPDPMRWEAPSSLSDALGEVEGRPVIAGLGPGKLLDEPISGQGKKPGMWQWFLTDFGQHLLIKRRAKLSELSEWSRPRVREAAVGNVRSLPTGGDGGQAQLAIPADPEEGIRSLERRGFPTAELGRFLHFYASRGASASAAFAVLLSERLRGDD